MTEQLYAEGAALYKQGKYRAAAERWEEAYRLYPDPNLAYNLGRAYEASGQLQLAKAAFERCAIAPDVTPEVRSKAMERGRIVNAAIAAAAATPAKPDPAPTPEPTPQPQPAQNGGASGLAVAGWTSAILGGGLVVGGGVFYLLGALDHAEVDDAKAAQSGQIPASLTQTEAQKLIDDGESNKTLGVILLSSGVVLGGLATTFFLLDGDGGEVQVSAAPLSGGGALVVGGQF